MGNIAARLVMFSILLNLAAAITMTAVVDIDGQAIFNSTATTGFSTTNADEYSDEYITELEKSIQPSGMLEDPSDQSSMLLDMMSLGFVYRFIDVVKTYMFGFVIMLDNTIGNYLDDSVRVMVFGDGEVKLGVLKSMITISYILMGIYLFTGKDVVEGS